MMGVGRAGMVFGLVAALGGGCQSDPGAGPGGAERTITVAPGDGRIWMVSNEPPPSDPKYYEARTAVVIEGQVSEVAFGPPDPPAGLHVFFSGQGATRVLTLHSDDGVDWRLGFHLESAARRVTPDLGALAGKRVRLLFRAIRGFGTAPGFVLSDASGLVLAIDLAVYGDPLKPDDVPGLTIADGDTLGTEKGRCFDRRHANLIFRGDAPLEVAPGAEAMVRIGGADYDAVNLYNYQADGPITCTDVAGGARGWGVWRR